MNSLRGRAFLFAAVLSSLLALPSVSLAQGNLYRDVMSHKATLMWRPAKPEIPQDVCSFLSACDGGEEKMVTLPPATIEGHQVGRAIFWTQMKGKDAFILEHQTHTEAYFFLLGPDGSLQKTVYYEPGKPFYLVANETGQPIFDKDKKDWSTWVAKEGAAK